MPALYSAQVSDNSFLSQAWACELTHDGWEMLGVLLSHATFTLSEQPKLQDLLDTVKTALRDDPRSQKKKQDFQYLLDEICLTLAWKMQTPLLSETTRRIRGLADEEGQRLTLMDELLRRCKQAGHDLCLLRYWIGERSPYTFGYALMEPRHLPPSARPDPLHTPERFGEALTFQIEHLNHEEQQRFTAALPVALRERDPWTIYRWYQQQHQLKHLRDTLQATLTDALLPELPGETT